MQATLSAQLAPMVYENPHSEIRHILKGLCYSDIDIGPHLEEVEDALYHLLDTLESHDLEEKRIMERTFCPNMLDHLKSHSEITANLQKTIRMLHEAAMSPAPEWHAFNAQMYTTKLMIENHIVEFDDPLLMSAAAGN